MRWPQVVQRPTLAGAGYDGRKLGQKGAKTVNLTPVRQMLALHIPLATLRPGRRCKRTPGPPDTEGLMAYLLGNKVSFGNSFHGKTILPWVTV
jgi:hypothetical protein